jgi:hypothetical protein
MYPLNSNLITRSRNEESALRRVCAILLIVQMIRPRSPQLSTREHSYLSPMEFERQAGFAYTVGRSLEKDHVHARLPFAQPAVTGRKPEP